MKIQTKDCGSLLFLLLFLLLGNINTQAGINLGYDISYEQTDSFTYRVNVDLFRQCNSPSTSAPLLRLRNEATGKTDTLYMSLIKIEDISLTCDSYSNPCSPSNTNSGKGLEKHQYTRLVNLNLSRYKDFKGGCKIRFEVLECCRNNKITTGAANLMYYNYTMIDLCKSKANHSAKFTHDPELRLPLNHPAYVSWAATDEDGDSLSYHISPIYKNYGDTAKLKKGLSYIWPLTFYDPVGNRYSNPNTVPPLGISLNQESGSMAFTPTNFDIGPISVEVREWRKNTSGSYDLVGVVRRDIQFTIESVPNNNSPVYKGPRFLVSCDGDKNFIRLQGKDHAKTIPPKSPPPPDSTTWEIKPQIDGLIVTKTKALNEIIELGWDPKRSFTTGKTYFVYASLRDNHCTLSLRNHYPIKIQRFLGSRPTTNIKDLGCGQYEFKASLGTNIPQNFQMRLRITQLNGTTSNFARFSDGKNDKFVSSNSYQDYITFHKTGTYLIQSSNFGSAPGYCVYPTVDTVVVKSIARSIHINNKTVCDYNQILPIRQMISDDELKGGASLKVNCVHCGTHSLNKIVQDSTQHGEIKLNFDLSEFKVRSNRKDSMVLQMIFTDTFGCTAIDTGIIYVNPVPEIKFSAIPEMCWDLGEVDLKKATSVSPLGGHWYCYDTTIAYPGFRRCSDSLMNGALRTHMLGGDTIDTKQTTPLGGVYYMRYGITQLNCPSFRDTLLTINPLPKPRIDRQSLGAGAANQFSEPVEICDDEPEFALIAAPVGGTWSLSQGTLSKPGRFLAADYPLNTPFYIQYHYTDAKGCKGFDSVKVTVVPGPTIWRNGDTLFTSGGKSHQWFLNSSPIQFANRNWYIITEKGDYSVEVNQKCGIRTSGIFTVDQLGVPLVRDDQFTVFPNPARKQISVRLTGNSKTEIAMYDVHGNCVYRNINHQKVHTIRTGHLARGIYLLEVKNENRRSGKKVILE